MSQSAAYYAVEMGALYLDIWSDVPESWHNLLDPSEIDRPEDVAALLGRHMFDGSVSDTSTILDMIGLDSEDDREAHGFSNTLDTDPDYNITDEELVTEWRREIIRRRNGEAK